VEGTARLAAQPSLSTLLEWAADASAALRREVPDRIHAQSGDREDWGNAVGIIRGLPFSRDFERYMDHDLDSRHAVVRALWRMRREASPGFGRSMFRVCLALLQGDEPDEIRRQMRLTEFAFATAAYHGLSTLRIKADAEERGERRAA
jgi:hypothetical protein